MLRSHAYFLAFLAVSVVAICFLTVSMISDKKSPSFVIPCNADQDGPLYSRNRSGHERLLSKLDARSKLIEHNTSPLDISPKCKREVFLILLVISSPDGFIRRNAIRATWGQSYAKSRHKYKENAKLNKVEAYFPEDVVKTVFLIGSVSQKDLSELVQTEARVFGDIVLGRLHDHYGNLTMKTRLGLKWAYHNCKAKYILKTDDDVFINPVPLVEWLRTQSRQKFYSGWCNFNSPVVRDPHNKWYVSYEDFTGSSYPGYCLGGGYVLSDDVLERILSISYGRKLFPLEDIYVGMMIKDLGDVEPIDNKESFNLVFGSVHGCGYNTLYLAHPVNPNDQLKMLLEAELAQRTCR